MWDRSKEAPVPETTSIRSAVSVELRLVTDTDRHSAMAYAALAQRRAVKINRASVVVDGVNKSSSLCVVVNVLYLS